jgi:hypothetical protein
VVAERALAAWGRGASLLYCSDEAIDPRLFAGLPATPGPGSAFADLTALSQCDAVLGPPSTFSGWASFSGRVPLLSLDRPDRPVDRAGFAVSGAG